MHNARRPGNGIRGADSKLQMSYIFLLSNYPNSVLSLDLRYTCSS